MRAGESVYPHARVSLPRCEAPHDSLSKQQAGVRWKDHRLRSSCRGNGLVVIAAIRRYCQERDHVSAGVIQREPHDLAAIVDIVGENQIERIRLNKGIQVGAHTVLPEEGTTAAESVIDA